MGINNMTGYDFTTRLFEYIGTSMEKYGPKLGSVSKIESNPKKSTHLETASMKILGLDFDFVNLRRDVHQIAPGIRNPKTRCPPPRLHINTLFYNLHTELLENFRGLSLQDMAARLIHALLRSKESFADYPPTHPSPNPLCLTPRLYHSSYSQARHQTPGNQGSALKTKISNEHVGIEGKKMIKGCNPHASLSLIHEVDLYNEIFAPPIQDLPLLPVQDMKIAADIMHHQLFGATSSYLRIAKLLTTTSKKYLAWLIVTTSPRKNQPLFLADRKNTPATSTAIKKGLRCPNSMSGTRAKAFANWKVIQNMVINLEYWGRDKTGLIMRALGRCLLNVQTHGLEE
ncbi:hypothetical protein L873DRAFT_1849697 [Choiromyces venosus 120613-1]|uniref:Uncharacterized protein n=1 Tax=Choiromyces venosus 120613-1 TaxID=1336337 RepID=A0A3N4IRP1_9PEZI|nr:hypothetical protein L873DRAFT_1849697 [Choiromyces venosus 120613-1]